MKFIARPSAKVRFFPTVDQLLGGGSGDAARILSLAENPFKFGPSRSSLKRLGGALWCHRQGVQAELENRWKLAAFFWLESHSQLASLTKQAESLTAIVAGLLKNTLRDSSFDAAEVSRRLIEEVFIDTHVAFFNGRLGQKEPLPAGDRAFYHFAQIKTLVGYSDMGDQQKAALLSAGYAASVDSLRSAKRWKEGAAAAGQWYQLDPENVAAQSTYIGIVAQAAIDALPKDDSASPNTSATQVLQDAISELGKLRVQARYNNDLYEALADLHFLLAIRIANSGQVSQALVHTQKALTIRPSFAKAEESRTKLVEMMKDLRATVAKLEEEIGRTPGAVFNEKGRALQREASAGFGPMNAFISSNEAASIGKFSLAARNRALWRRIGLPKPEDSWDEKATRLVEGLSTVAATGPKDRAMIAGAWNSAAGERSELAVLDTVKVLDFLSHWLLNEPLQPTEAEVVDKPTCDTKPPVFVGKEKKATDDNIPFSYWLCTARDLGLKWRLALAAPACAAVVMLGWHEKEQRGQRSRAFAAFTEARAVQNQNEVIAAAENFLSAHPFSKDLRESTVLEGYEQAFVQWFNHLRELTPADKAKIDRFRTLTTGRI
jgi:hypothetical protein